MQQPERVFKGKNTHHHHHHHQQLNTKHLASSLTHFFSPCPSFSWNVLSRGAVPALPSLPSSLASAAEEEAGRLSPGGAGGMAWLELASEPIVRELSRKEFKQTVRQTVKREGQRDTTGKTGRQTDTRTIIYKQTKLDRHTDQVRQAYRHRDRQTDQRIEQNFAAQHFWDLTLQEK